MPAPGFSLRLIAQACCFQIVTHPRSSACLVYTYKGAGAARHQHLQVHATACLLVSPTACTTIPPSERNTHEEPVPERLIVAQGLILGWAVGTPSCGSLRLRGEWGVFMHLPWHQQCGLCAAGRGRWAPACPQPSLLHVSAGENTQQHCLWHAHCLSTQCPERLARPDCDLVLR